MDSQVMIVKFNSNLQNLKSDIRFLSPVRRTVSFRVEILRNHMLIENIIRKDLWDLRYEI